ncbi:unnamed protein product [Parnassius mnemosyne]|uniref:FP protein C-terminal domain-containing protein n=1 Tax=Parnassius mnemosyne TaxID=213953 RepID=A0AAV1L5T0_9NEOP
MQCSGISPRDTSSNITIRRTKPTHLTQSQEPLTLESIKHIIHDEMNAFINKIESNISKIIENKIKGLTKEITDLKESVLFITNQYEDLKKDMQVKFKDVKHLKEENDCLKSTVKDLNSRLSIMEQHSRMSNLEIQCIPEHRAENIPHIITQIGKITGTKISDAEIHKCTRIAKINPENARPRSIIVKFACPRVRDTFLAGVINFNKRNTNEKLNTSHIGIGGNKKPIFVVEHLTPELKKIHAHARATAKKLKYKFVWIKNGRVFLRKTDNSEHIVVRNIEQLKELQ